MRASDVVCWKLEGGPPVTGLTSGLIIGFGVGAACAREQAPMVVIASNAIDDRCSVRANRLENMTLRDEGTRYLQDTARW